MVAAIADLIYVKKIPYKLIRFRTIRNTEEYIGHTKTLKNFLFILDVIIIAKIAGKGEKSIK